VKLIFIYGPPAVGKTTVGSKLAKLTGYRFFFNHLTVPAAKAIFPDSGERNRDEEYWRLLRRLRLDTIETAADDGLDTIFTVAYQGAVDDDFVSDIVDAVTSRGGEVNFVQLVAPEHVLMERVGNKSRKDLQMGKMTERVHLKRALVPGMFETVKYANVLKLDTSKLSAKDAAERIANYFRLATSE
jgi:gluconate kinase